MVRQRPGGLQRACARNSSCDSLELADYCVELADPEGCALPPSFTDREVVAGLAARPEGPPLAAGAAGPCVGYAVSLGLGPSTEGVGSIPNSPRSPIASPATQEAYYESLGRFEICSIELQDSNQDGGATGSVHGAAKGLGRASGPSRTGAQPAAAGRGRPPWARQRPPWKADRGRGGHPSSRKAPRL